MQEQLHSFIQEKCSNFLLWKGILVRNIKAEAPFSSHKHKMVWVNDSPLVQIIRTFNVLACCKHPKHFVLHLNNVVINNHLPNFDASFVAKCSNNFRGAIDEGIFILWVLYGVYIRSVPIAQTSTTPTSH